MKFFDTLLAAMKMAPEEARKVLGLDKVDPEGKLEVFGTVVLDEPTKSQEAAYEFRQETRMLDCLQNGVDALCALGRPSTRFKFVTFGHPTLWQVNLDFSEDVVMGLWRDTQPYRQVSVFESELLPRRPEVASLEVTIPDVAGILKHRPELLLRGKSENNFFLIYGWGKEPEVVLPGEKRPLLFEGMWNFRYSEMDGRWKNHCDNYFKHWNCHRLFFPGPT